MSDRLYVHGAYEPRFGPVIDVFVENFRERNELGASLCIHLRGRKVVDVWAGWARVPAPTSRFEPMEDPEARVPWRQGTVSVGFSTTKGVVALAFAMLHERGGFDYTQPVTEYWPEFARHGKGRLTIGEMLDHRGGLLSTPRDFDVADMADRREQMAALMEDMKPYWEPGRDQGYHAITFGLLAGELFARITGESLGAFIAREITSPLGAEFHLGLSCELEHLTARLAPPGRRTQLFEVLPKAMSGQGIDGRVFHAARDPSSLTTHAFRYPTQLGLKGLSRFNEPFTHQLELPWAGGLTNARGLSTIYAAIIGGDDFPHAPLLSEGTLARLRRRESWSVDDRVLHKPMGFSLGFLKEDTALFSPNPESFGHPGAGGALGWADPTLQLAIGYSMNRMAPNVRSPRALALTRAIYNVV